MAKRKKTRSKKQYVEKSELTTLLMTRGYTMPDLKEEISLIIAGMLFKLYIKRHNNKLGSTLYSHLPQDKKEYLHNFIFELEEAIHTNLMSFETLQAISDNANNGLLNNRKAVLVRPILFFYNETVIKMKTRAKNIITSDLDLEADSIAISLLYAMKYHRTRNKEIAFSKFPWLAKFDIDKAFKINSYMNKELASSLKISNFKTNYYQQRKIGFYARDVLLETKYKSSILTRKVDRELQAS